MITWATLRRAGAGAAIPFLLLFVSPLRAADDAGKPTKSSKPTAAELRSAAETAEKAGDWEAAFTAYCHLFVADREAPDVREKLNTALRRTQQLRRHRDPQFQQYAATTTVSRRARSVRGSVHEGSRAVRRARPCHTTNPLGDTGSRN